MPTQAEQTQVDTGTTPPVDDFDTAFDDAIGDVSPAENDSGGSTSPEVDSPSPEGEVEVEGGGKPPAEKSAEGDGEGKPPADNSAENPTEGDAPPAGGSDTPTETPAGSSTPTAEPTKRTVADYTAEELAELLSKRQQPAEEQKDEAPPKEPTLDDFLSDEDREVLDAYEKDWGEVSKAESILRRAEGELLRTKIINEVAAALAPIAQYIQQSQVTGHFEAIEKAHPGYEKMVPQVQEWIATQPAPYQPYLKHVLEAGNSAQVIELFDLYKESTSAPPATPASSEPTQVDDAAAKKAEQQRKAAAATAAVSTSRRQTKVGAKDDNDFDAAFDEAANLV